MLDVSQKSDVAANAGHDSFYFRIFKPLWGNPYEESMAEGVNYALFSGVNILTGAEMKISTPLDDIQTFKFLLNSHDVFKLSTTGEEREILIKKWPSFHVVQTQACSFVAACEAIPFTGRLDTDIENGQPQQHIIADDGRYVCIPNNKVRSSYTSDPDGFYQIWGVSCRNRDLLSLTVFDLGSELFPDLSGRNEMTRVAEDLVIAPTLLSGDPKYKPLSSNAMMTLFGTVAEGPLSGRNVAIPVSDMPTVLDIRQIYHDYEKGLTTLTTSSKVDMESFYLEQFGRNSYFGTMGDAQTSLTQAYRTLGFSISNAEKRKKRRTRSDTFANIEFVNGFRIVAHQASMENRLSRGTTVYNTKKFTVPAY